MMIKQKLWRKSFLYSAMILLLAGAVVIVWPRTHSVPEGIAAPNLLLIATPIPCPLPTQIYDAPSYLTTVLRQIFAKRERPLNPSQVAKEGQRQAENEYTDLYALNGYLPVDIQWWQQKSRQVYEYVSQRFAATVKEKVVVTFLPPGSGNCAARGTTFHETQPVIVIYANPETSKEQILAVLAHEFGHVFIHQQYGTLSDIALNEGMATWTAGEYWKAWKGVDFDSGVRSFLNNKTYLPLFQNYDLEQAYDDRSPDCLFQRDILLTEMASFLDYLIQSYGTESLSSLLDMQRSEFVSKQRVIYPPKYKNVYGLEFNQLEYEWLKSLLQPTP